MLCHVITRGEQREVSYYSHMNSGNTTLSVKFNSGMNLQPRPKNSSYKPIQGPRRNGSDSQTVCEFCHLTGHTKEKC